MSGATDKLKRSVDDLKQRAASMKSETGRKDYKIDVLDIIQETLDLTTFVLNEIAALDERVTALKGE